MDDEAVRIMHPSILASKLLSKEGNRWVFERSMHSFGRTFNLTWRFELRPMESFREDVIASTGGLAPGSFIENIYSDEDNSTKVSTKGEMAVLGVPSFMQLRILGRVFGQSDKEDLRYLTRLESAE